MVLGVSASSSISSVSSACNGDAPVPAFHDVGGDMHR